MIFWVSVSLLRVEACPGLNTAFEAPQVWTPSVSGSPGGRLHDWYRRGTSKALRTRGKDRRGSSLRVSEPAWTWAGGWLLGALCLGKPPAWAVGRWQQRAACVVGTGEAALGDRCDPELLSRCGMIVLLCPLRAGGGVALMGRGLVALTGEVCTQHILLFLRAWEGPSHEGS